MAKVITRSIPFTAAAPKVAKPAPKAPKKAPYKLPTTADDTLNARSTARLLLALQEAQEALRDLTHERGCICTICRRAGALEYMLGVIAGVVDSEASPEAFDEMRRVSQQRAAA